MRARLMVLGGMITLASCEQKPASRTEARATVHDARTAVTATAPIDAAGSAPIQAVAADASLHDATPNDATPNDATPNDATPNSTIGIGRYGTVTVGSGTGRPPELRRQRPGPQVRYGKATIEGTLVEGIIRRFVRRRHMQVLYCYEKQLLVTPGLEGVVTLDFVIAPSGKVSSANATGVHPDVAMCVARIARALEFPEPTGGGIVKVRYPLTFTSRAQR